MKRIEDWVCPICGHNLYEEIFGDNFVTEVETSAEGHVTGTQEGAVSLGFECTCCTVTFGDPRKFNRTALNKITNDPINLPTKDNG